MKMYSCLFVFVLCLFAGQALGEKYVPPQPAENNSTTSTTTPKTTTTAITPTTHPSTTTTTASTTPITPTTSTTTSTTTTAKTPTTTTKITTTTPQTTTSTAAPTPAPTPKPEPKPKIGSWNVTYPNVNNTCIKMQAALEVEIIYINNLNKTISANVTVPDVAKASGNCGKDDQQITISWANNSITFMFKDGNKKYNLTHVDLTFTPTDFNGTIKLVHDKNDFKTSIGSSYKCDKLQVFNLTNSDVKVNATGILHLSHVQFEAFQNTTSKGFASAEDCEPFDTPDIVPIAVGCALIALIIIVVITYIIGRRRAQARGYLSI